MINKDKELIIANELEKLNYFLKERIKEADKNIVFWKEKIEKYGNNMISAESAPITYQDCLILTKKNKESFEKEIRENEALIKELRGWIFK